MSDEQAIAVKGFDIGGNSVETIEDAGKVVHIEDENDRPMYYGENGDRPITITVAGTYSRLYRAAETRIRKRPFKGARKLNSEVLYEDNIEKVVACTLAWEGFVIGDQPIPLNPHNAAMLYKKFPWVLEQVAEEMADHANFSRSSSPTQ